MHLTAVHMLTAYGVSGTFTTLLTLYLHARSRARSTRAQRIARGTVDTCAPRWALKFRSRLPGLSLSNIVLGCWFWKRWHHRGKALVSLGRSLCTFPAYRPWSVNRAGALRVSAIEAHTVELAAVDAERRSSPPGSTSRSG